MNVLHAPCLQLHRPFLNPSNMPRSCSSAGPLPMLAPPFLLSHPGPYCLSNPIHSSLPILDIFSKQTLQPEANYLFLSQALQIPCMFPCRGTHHPVLSHRPVTLSLSCGLQELQAWLPALWRISSERH